MDINGGLNTYENSIIGFVAFRLQFHHVLDEDFGVPAKQCFDAIYSMKMEAK